MNSPRWHSDCLLLAFVSSLLLVLLVSIGALIAVEPHWSAVKGGQLELPGCEP